MLILHIRLNFVGVLSINLCVWIKIDIRLILLTRSFMFRKSPEIVHSIIILQKKENYFLCRMFKFIFNAFEYVWDTSANEREIFEIRRTVLGGFVNFPKCQKIRFYYNRGFRAQVPATGGPEPVESTVVLGAGTGGQERGRTVDGRQRSEQVRRRTVGQVEPIVRRQPVERMEPMELGARRRAYAQAAPVEPVELDPGHGQVEQRRGRRQPLERRRAHRAARVLQRQPGVRQVQPEPVAGRFQLHVQSELNRAWRRVRLLAPGLHTYALYAYYFVP